MLYFYIKMIDIVLIPLPYLQDLIYPNFCLICKVQQWVESYALEIFLQILSGYGTGDLSI